jgi:hypothetical protein
MKGWEGVTLPNGAEGELPVVVIGAGPSGWRNLLAAFPVRKSLPHPRSTGFRSAITSRMSRPTRFRPVRARIFSRSRFIARWLGQWHEEGEAT